MALQRWLHDAHHDHPMAVANLYIAPMMLIAPLKTRVWFAHELCVFMCDSPAPRSLRWWLDFIRLFTWVPVDELFALYEKPMCLPPAMVGDYGDAAYARLMQEIVTRKSARGSWDPSCAVIERLLRCDPERQWIPAGTAYATQKFIIVRDQTYQLSEVAFVMQVMESHAAVALYVMIGAMANAVPTNWTGLLRLKERTTEYAGALSKTALTRRFFRLVVQLPNDLVRRICRVVFTPVGRDGLPETTYECPQRMTSADVRFIERAVLYA